MSRVRASDLLIVAAGFTLRYVRAARTSPRENEPDEKYNTLTELSVAFVVFPITSGTTRS